MDRDIAMVFQNYALYPHMSVFDNMAYGLKIAGTPKGEIRSRVEQAAAMLQLEQYLDRRPRELSGGQRQRVAMGRAIVRKPAVFLFDEPLSNLDAKLRVQMRLEIKQLQRELGVTSLYVTHDQVEAMTLADRMIVMNAGRADQIGAPARGLRRPRRPSSWPASSARRRRTSSMPTLWGWRAPRRARRAPREHGAAPSPARLRGRVLYAEPLGAETLVHVRLPDGSTATVRQDGTGAIPRKGPRSA